MVSIQQTSFGFEVFSFFFMEPLLRKIVVVVCFVFVMMFSLKTC